MTMGDNQRQQPIVVHVDDWITTTTTTGYYYTLLLSSFILTNCHLDSELMDDNFLDSPAGKSTHPARVRLAMVSLGSMGNWRLTCPRRKAQCR